MTRLSIFAVALAVTSTLFAACGDDEPASRGDGGGDGAEAGDGGTPGGGGTAGGGMAGEGGRPDSGGAGGEGGGRDGPNDSVEEVLTDMGVDITVTDRVDVDGDPLPEDHAPLGSNRTLNRFAEVTVFGVPFDDAAASGIASMGRMTTIDLVPEVDSFETLPLHDEAIADTPWLSDDTIPRAAANGDFDGDGQEEIAVVYQLSSNEPIELRIMEDSAEGQVFGEASVVDTRVADQLFATSGDFDGNGTVELVIGIVVYETGTTLLWVDNDGTQLSPTTTTIDIPRRNGTATQAWLRAGNLDYDKGMELAVVINEFDGDLLAGSGTISGGNARHFVYDDANTGFEELRSGNVVITTDEQTVTAINADVSLADVDGDAVDELVLAGLTVMGNTSSASVEYAIEVFDDAKRDYASMASVVVPFDNAVLQASSSGASQHMNALLLATPDLDGNGAKDIVANEYVFADLRRSPGLMTVVETIPVEEIYTRASSGQSYRFNWATYAYAAGDIDSDRREELLIVTQSGSTEHHRLQIWGDEMIGGWSKVLEYRMFQQGYDFSNRPQILTADLDIDNESVSLTYSAGSHQLVFTEPVIIAALAAAPCSTELGQDLSESCRTAFGQGVSATTEETNGFSFVAGVSVGFDGTVPFVGGPEVLLETRNTLSFYDTNGYTLTKRVLRETGALEDSVIFTTIPLDLYTYEILSHPNPDLVGERIVIRMPREPITVMVARDFYNEHTLEDAFKIDDAIFRHTAGDPASYPTAAQKNALLVTYAGLESEQLNVGQGTGQTIVSINEFTTSTNGKSYEFEAVLNLKATSGSVVGGFAIGGGANYALAITRGEENIYQGSVGNIAAEFFPDRAYDFGLFSYIYEEDPSDPGEATTNSQKFEVLGYWVEQ
jgi:hypothetical protein